MADHSPQSILQNNRLAALATAPVDDLQYGVVSLYGVFIKSTAAKRALLPALLPAMQQDADAFALLTCRVQHNIMLDGYALDAATSHSIITQNAYLHAASVLHTARQMGLRSETLFGYNTELVSKKFLRNVRCQPLLLLALHAPVELADSRADGVRADNIPTHDTHFVII